MRHLPLILFVFLMPVCVQAQEADYTKIKLLSATQGIGNLAHIDLGLEVTLKDDWHTYWRMPGDSGLAPVISIDGSENVKDLQIKWPTPSRIITADMHSFGYLSHVLFPMTLIPETPGKDAVLKMKMDYMICHEICIPQTIELERTFAAREPVRSEDAPRIETAIANLPNTENSNELGIGTAILGKDAVAVTVFSKTPLPSNAELIIDAPNSILTKPAEIIPPSNHGGDYILKVRGPSNVDLTDKLFGKTVKALLISGDAAIEKEISF
jgi:suppressor for copper-sensitivity B